MPRYTDLRIALPCQRVDDLNTDISSSQAKSLLACWTALWHPTLIASANVVPRIQPIDDRPDWQPSANCRPLLTIPTVAETALDSQTLMDWQAECDLVLIEQPLDRAAAAKKAIDSSQYAVQQNQKLDQSLVLDFYALGYAYLQVQLMTLQLRYSSNLDSEEFQTLLMVAVDAAFQSDHDAAIDRLAACFDLLLQEKNSYYPVEPQLCELVLTHSNTLGGSLERQLANHDRPLSMLVSGSDARTIAAKNPDTAQTIRQRIADKTLSIIGGLGQELASPLLSDETTVNQLTIGRQAFETSFACQPKIFARRRFGLTPSLPNILQKFGYTGAIHASFENGTVPDAGGGIMRWTGDGDEPILASCDAPMDANDATTFLRLSIRAGEMIDSAHSATALLTHWPDTTSEFFQDLLTVCSYVPLLGNFVTLEELFEEAYDPGYSQSFTADEYVAPFLKQAIDNQKTDPISRFPQYWSRIAQLQTAGQLLLSAAATNAKPRDAVQPVLDRMARLQANIELATEAKESESVEIEIELASILEDSLSLAATSSNAQASNQYLILNPSSAKRRTELRLSHPTEKERSIKNSSPVAFAAGNSGRPNDSTTTWIVDLPPFSKTLIDAERLDSKNHFAGDPPLAGEHFLQNEFFVVRIDPDTGGVRSVQPHNSRVNIVGQQLSLRLPGKRHSAQRYAQMVADQIEITQNESLSATIQSVGTLNDGDHPLATFRQSVRVIRGVPRLEFSTKIELLQPLTTSINHYVCSRLAWKSEAARTFANVMESRNQVTGQWFNATNFFTVVDEHSFTMLTGGLPYHRRPSRRMIDSLLMVAGETKSTFSFAIDFDQRYPLSAATNRLSPACCRPLTDTSQVPPSPDWLFHFDSKNVLATHSQPTFDDNGQCDGAMFRLRETEKRNANLTITCVKPLAGARIVGFNGAPIDSLAVSGDDHRKVKINIKPLSYLQVKLLFKS